MSFNQQLGVTNNPLSKARGDDLINEKVIQRWWKVRFPQHSFDRAYYKEWVQRLRVAYYDEGPDAFPWQADNQSIRTWKKVTGRRQLRINTKDEATIKGSEPVKKRPVDPREQMQYARFIQGNGKISYSIASDLKGMFTGRLMKLRDYNQQALSKFNKVYPFPRDSKEKQLNEYVSQCLQETLELMVEGSKIVKKAEDLDRLMEATYKKANPKMNY